MCTCKHFVLHVPTLSRTYLAHHELESNVIVYYYCFLCGYY